MAESDSSGPGSSHGLREFDMDGSVSSGPVVETWDDQMKATTEEQFEASARFAAQQKALREKKQRARKRQIIIVSIATVAAVAAGIPLTRAVMREAATADSLRGGLDEVSKPLTTIGFNTAKEWFDVPTAGLVIDVPADSCSAIAAIPLGGKEMISVHVERPKAIALDGKGVVWCTCEAERVTVKYPDTSLPRVALRWLSRHAAEVGGAEVLATRDLRPFAYPDDPTSLGCSDPAFKSWSGLNREADLQPIDPKKPEAAARFLAEGMDPTGLFPTDRTFGVLRAEKERCYIAAPDKPGMHYSVRSDEGKRLVPDTTGAVGLCSYAGAKTFSFWRPKGSTGNLIVAHTASEKLGGLAGLHELATRLKLDDLKLLYEDKDLQPDAIASLKASSVAPNTIVTPDSTGLPGKLDAMVVSFSMGALGSFFPEVSPPVPYACLPELAPAEVPRTLVCAQSRPQVWRSDAPAKTQGAAEAKYPVWLAMFQGVTDKEGLKSAARMLAFARRMTLLGFEPSTTDGVIDQADGATISGRQGRDLTVAVGLVKRAPWIVPLTEGAAWTLDGPIQPIKLPLGKTIKVRGRQALGGDPGTRRVVVWRK
ncbi:MAG: hypothetical protein HY898_05215 [Deltaproteobacteria bacterium]|nr:hypothetical protein [Deltaproteobacteria bacterium]